MHNTTQHTQTKRRPVNLTIREDILNTAKDLNLNASKAAEAGITAAIREAQSRQWLEENHAALDAHNRRIAQKGTLLKPRWSAD